MHEYFQPHYLEELFERKVAQKFTRGIDGISIPQFQKNKDANLKLISDKILSGTFAYSPYLEKLKPKGRNKEPRIISIPTVRDRIVLLSLKNILHSYFPECVQRALPNEYIRDINNFYTETNKDSLCFYKLDIKRFYERIDQQILLDKIRTKITELHIVYLIQKAIQNPTVPRNYDRNDKYKYYSHVGVPQGLAISNILANIYMQDYDNSLRSKCRYTRYVDDILIFNYGHPDNCLKSYSEDLLKELGLELNEKKTFCKENKRTFEYLGYFFDFPKISVRESTVQRFINSIAASFAEFKNTYRQSDKIWLTHELKKSIFIDEINEKITGAISENRRYGWVFYFLEINDHELLHRIDSIIRSLFIRLDMFGCKPPINLKRISKAYYQAKYAPLDGYIHNYNKYDTIAQKLEYILNKGVIDPKDQDAYSAEQIISLFNQCKNKMLTSLEMDIGKMS